MDFIYVNIMNEGVIPYIREKGPLFGYKMASGVYSILVRDPRIKMEVATYTEAIEAKKKFIESKKSIEVVKNDFIVEDTPIVEDTEEIIEKEMTPESNGIISEISAILNETVESDENDDEIDRILEAEPEIKSSMIVTFKDDLDINNSNVTNTETKTEDRVYSNKELMSMTKAQLRQILRDRGYTTGIYAPKYQDNLSKLRSKVKKTQSEN